MLFPPTALERAMQIRDVLVRAMNKEYSWLRAARDPGDHSARLEAGASADEEQFGYQGLVDRRRGRPSPRRTPVPELERILELYRERYSGFNARHFFQTVRREHGVKLSYTCVKQLLQAAGLIQKRRSRGRHRRKRERKPRFGQMLHLDGSRHGWLALVPEDRQTLIQVVDDATSRLLYAQLWCRGDDPGGDVGDAGGGPRARDPRIVLHGPGGVGFRHAQGRRQGEQDEPDSGRRGSGSFGGRAHPLLLTAGSRTIGADEPHLAGSPPPSTS